MARHLVSEAVGARVNSDNTTAVIVSLNSGVDPVVESPTPKTSQKAKTLTLDSTQVPPTAD